jgi:hypothetical protein
MSQYPITSEDIHSVGLETIHTKNAAYIKPRGIWYAFDDNAWADFTEKSQKYIYEVHLKRGVLTTDLSRIGMSKVLQVKTQKKLHAFHEKYGYTPSGFTQTSQGKELKQHFGKRHHFIDWKRVMDDFSGIEIYADPGKRKTHNLKHYDIGMADYMWWDYFDIVSGCIWKQSVIDEWKLVDKPRMSPGVPMLRWKLEAQK